MGETVHDGSGGEVLCSKCKEPLPLWSLDYVREDQDINFVQPPAAAHLEVEVIASDLGEMLITEAPKRDVITHSVSPISDLMITLSNEETVHRYLVSSQILRVVSPVWRTHLRPDTPFRAHEVEVVDGRQHSVTELEDDDPDTLLAVLNILHFSTENVPISIDFQQLKSFAVLCDKYDCVIVLRMWSKSWLDQWAGVVLEPGYEDWLFVAKVFKDQRNIKELEELLVEECSSLSTCGTYFLRTGTEVSTSLIPDVILKRVMDSRERELKRQIGIWRHFLQTYVSENVAKGCPNWDCVTLSYGNLIRSIEQSGLVKVLKMTEQWHGNIKDFEAKMGGIHLANGTRFHGYGWCPVENLNVSLRSDLKRISTANRGTC